MKLLPSAHPGPRLAVIAILGVLLARPTVAQSTTPTFVQAATFSTGSRVSTVTVTLTQSVAQGDMLVGWVSQYGAAEEVQVSDNVNGAWTRGPGSTRRSRCQTPEPPRRRRTGKPTRPTYPPGRPIG